MKRIILVLFISFFSIMLLSCVDPLKEERKKAISELDEYYNNLDTTLFDDNFLISVHNVIDMEKDIIMRADSKEIIRSCVSTAKNKIEDIRIASLKKSKYEKTIEEIFNKSKEFTCGTGTIEDPYIIDTPKKLLYLSKETYEGNSEGVYYALGCDIDLQNMKWVPIGYIYNIYKGNSFKGHFDGKGYKIINLFINNKHNDYYEVMRYIGLFGTNEGIIQNVGLVDLKIKFDFSYDFGIDYSKTIGSICSINEGIINNCYIIGNIDFYYGDFGFDYSTSPDDFYISKIAGSNTENGVISNCLAFVEIVIASSSEGDSDYSLLALSDGECHNCLSVGSLCDHYSCDDETRFLIDGTRDNNYVYANPYQHGYGPIKSYEINNCNEEDLNNKSFYTDTLGWDEEIWDLEDIIFENGAYVDGHYPKLKNLVD